MKPDFLIVGAHKCGTTSLFDTITGDAGVAKPRIKEPHYFVAHRVSETVNGVVREKDEYLKLFESKGNRISGEASVLYLRYSDEACPQIESLLGVDTKIIVCIRNPIHRAYSAYLDLCRHNELETRCFERALEDELEGSIPDYLPPTAAYLRMGVYAKDIMEFKKYFVNTKILVMEDLIDNPSCNLKQVFEFLGLKGTSPGVVQHSNAGSTTWKNKFLRQFILFFFPRKFLQLLRENLPLLHKHLVKIGNKNFYGNAEPITPRAREILVGYYAPHIVELEAVLGVDLSEKWAVS